MAVPSSRVWAANAFREAYRFLEDPDESIATMVAINITGIADALLPLSLASFVRMLLPAAIGDERF